MKYNILGVKVDIYDKPIAYDINRIYGEIIHERLNRIEKMINFVDHGHHRP